MPKLKILQEPNKLLRQPAEEVSLDEINTERIQNLIKDMSETLSSIEVGVGLAAPQVGESLKIFLVSEEVLAAKREKKKINPEEYKKHKASRGWKHLVFINPKIIRISKEKELLPEGCLSADKIYGQVLRSKRVVAGAYDENGKKFRRSASGLFAQVIQHEMDHLNCILFIDKAKNLQRLDEKKENGDRKS